MKLPHWLYYLKFYKNPLGLVAGGVLGSLIQSGALMGITLLVKQIFDKAIPEKDFSILLFWGISIVLLYMLNGSITLTVRYYILKATKLVIYTIRLHLTQKLYQFSKKFYDTTNPQYIHTIIVQDTERIDIMSNALIAQLIPSLIISTTICMGLLYLNPLFFLMTITVIPFIVLLSKWLGTKVQQSTQTFHKAFVNYSQKTDFILKNMETTVIQTATNQEINKQQKNIKHLSKSSLAYAWLQTTFTTVQDNMLAVSGVFMIVVGGYFVIQNQMSWGELFAFYVALALLKTYVYRIATNVPQVIEGNESLKSIYYLISHAPVQTYQGSDKINFQGNIRFENVVFAYQKSETLHHISFEIPAGKKIALMGLNGSGKSTIIKLILGLYSPQSGKIYADNHPYSEIDMEHLLTQTGVVMQKPILTEGSIYENLTYGLENITLEEVEKLCKQLEIHTFIQRLPQSYQTCLDTHTPLSGGQIQLLAIARALLRKPKLLVLDEPGNHLDSDKLEKLYEFIQIHCKDLTLLIVSHNPVLSDFLDEMWLMENGYLKQITVSI